MIAVSHGIELGQDRHVIQMRRRHPGHFVEFRLHVPRLRDTRAAP